MYSKLFHLLHVLWRKRDLAKSVGCRFSFASRVDERSRFECGVVIGGSTDIVDSSFGRNTYVADAKVAHADVGAFCSIGPEALIGSGTHPTNFVSTSPLFYSTRTLFGRSFAVQDLVDDTARVFIGNDVWIGAKAIIFNGTRIGHGAIIGAAALVNKDVPPYAIVGGVPAKILRMRFPDEVVDALLRWRWWELPDDILVKLADQFCPQSLSNSHQIRELRAKADSFMQTTTSDKSPSD